MNSKQNIAATTAIRIGTSHTDAALLSALEGRGNILLMTQQAEDAVLRPADTGVWSAALRIALAARIAILNGLPELAQHYSEMDDSAEYGDLAALDNDGRTHGLAHVVAYMDNVARCPRNIKAEDIRCLQQEGVSDADIVRLTELNAFMAYQVRLISALSLMGEGRHE
ncbi:MAG: hypothetical protein AB8B64_10410 [Granulosicoccus sp.]